MQIRSHDYVIKRGPWGACFYLSLLSSETLSFLRPFFLLLANTARPLADSMRLRNPCTVFLRLRWG